MKIYMVLESFFDCLHVNFDILVIFIPFILQGVMLATILWSTSCFRTRTHQTPDIALMLGQRRIRWFKQEMVGWVK